MANPLSNTFGVYVHWPFCKAKCPYCDFNSHVRHNGVDQQEFVKAYDREIAHMAAMAPNRTVGSIFFGGGTPSLMEPATVDHILNEIGKHWTIAETAEISLEANPTSVEAERFRGFREAGVNRVSLGIQSLRDDELAFFGRTHSAREAIDAIATAQSIFDRMSFDLIYARPKQTATDWEQELREAIDLSAGHLSLYQLTIEQGTRFFDLFKRGKIETLEEDRSAELYELTQAITKDAGFHTYEISNHAQPEQECQHNLVYWRGGDYAGIGPGAHGRITTNEGCVATSTFKNPEEWWQHSMTKGHGVEERTPLLADERADEYLLMGLRLEEGIQPEKYESMSGRAINPEQVEFLNRLGLLETASNGNLKATPEGFLVLDAVVADLAANLTDRMPL
jgi:oxygen-independent coproporphyrinogen-3 oxidase